MSDTESMKIREEKMRKVFLSFLGTNNYLPCNYICTAREPVKNVRFVQEATVSWQCREWKQDDKILIFNTEEAHKKNWLDNGHKDREGNAIQTQGLASRLNLLNIAAEIEEIFIPTGKNEQEIWKIFSTVVNKLEEKNELYLDITHAFRSLPLLSTVIINYAKSVKNITVKAISYGAMEAIGNRWEVEQLDIEKRNVPVFDLLPFDQLLDWSTAIDRFIGSGDATRINELTTEKVISRKKEVKGPDDEADNLKNMAVALDAFSKTMTTCRGKNISCDAEKLKHSISRAKEQQLIKPLTPLLEKLEKTVADFSFKDEVQDGLAAAQWCLKHNLIQQGFTLLQETICTFILKRSTDEDTSEKNKRNLVGMAVKIEWKNIPFNEWDEPAQKPRNREIIDKIRNWLRNHQSLLKHMNNISHIRNDLNHAGINNSPMNADKFADNLRKYISFFKEHI